MSEPNLPSKDDILALARWVLECPLIKEHYALTGGAWLTLRLPKEARLSKDVDVLSSREDISSHNAMLQIVEKCRETRIKYQITRRGEHFCQIFVRYPGKQDIKVDIGKIWHPVTLLYDPTLRCPILSPADMVLEKLHCMVDRIEPTDLYDLCLLHKSYPDEFRKALQELAKSMEAKELIIQIEKCLEATAGLGTKESLDDQQRSWMESYVVRVIKDITFVARHERSFGESS